MKVAIIGSRELEIKDLSPYLPENSTEIVSGGARGIDACAESFAKANLLCSTIFLPDYKSYGRAAPIVRNKQIVEYADEVIAFWDGSSRGTKYVIDLCRKTNKKCTVIEIKPESI